MNVWFIPAVATAVVYGLQAVYLKAYTGDLHRLVVAWSVFAFAAPVFVAQLAFTGLPTVSNDFWWALAVSLSINLVAWPMFVRSIQLSDVSLVMPLVAFTPVFILLVEWLLRGQVPEGWGLAGILVIVVGAYVLNVDPEESGPLGPLRSLFSDRGARMMLIVAALWSVSATVEKIAVMSSSPAFYLTTLSLGFTVAFLPVLLRTVDRPFHAVRTDVRVLVGAGVLTALMLVIQMVAIKATPLVNYVIAIKRAGMLVSVLLGWWLFGEGNIGFRAVGALLMVAGVVLIRVA
jgi:drug/metabolite transporter (DMT)-like permease